MIEPPATWGGREHFKKWLQKKRAKPAAKKKRKKRTSVPKEWSRGVNSKYVGWRP